MRLKSKFLIKFLKRFGIGVRYLTSILILSLLIPISMVRAQKLNTIKGVVTDEITGEFLSYVAVSIAGRAVGALTDNDGRFEFKARVNSSDSIRVNYVGYKVQVLALTDKSVQNFNIKLQEETYQLGEIVVTADPNPGRTLMKKVIKQNAINNPSNFNRFHAQRWELKQVDVLDPKADSIHVTKGLLFGDKARIFASLRLTDDSLKKETPLFFAEKISDYELTKAPFSESENQIAIKTTGFESDRFLEPLVKWNAGDINLYSDWVLMFNKNFVSPIGQDAFRYYNFYIVDSVKLNGGFYNINFQVIPKDWSDNVFSGYFTVNDSSFALVSANLRLSKNANINFIEEISIQQKYIPAINLENNNYQYVLNESRLTLQYQANLESLGIPIPISLGDKVLVCRMTVRNNNILLNNPLAADFAKPGALVSAKKLLDSGHDDHYWNSIRPDTLSIREALIYKMATEVKNDTKAKVRDKILSTLLAGVYYIGNQFYLGPIGSLISYNRIEGVRFRISVRTMEGIFPRSSVYGHLAYGLKDEQIKSSLGFRYIWNVQPYSRSQIFYSSDYDVVTEWYDQTDKDNITNSVLRKRNVPYYKVYKKQLAFSQDQQLGANFFLYFGFNYQQLDPSFNYSYLNPAYINEISTPDIPQYKHNVPSAEFVLGLRFAWHEAAKINNYTRFPLATKIPVFILSYTQGVKLRNDQFKYHKLSLNISHNTHITPKIDFIWNMEFGKVFNILPSLNLHQAPGSDSWVVSSRVFNLMTPYEFTSDRYAEFMSRFVFGGLLFDKIPLVKKLQLREKLIFNSFWGDLSQDNINFNKEQNVQGVAREPYIEIGAGIDNIFHVLSVNYIQRLNYLNSKGATGNRRGIFVGMKFIF